MVNFNVGFVYLKTQKQIIGGGIVRLCQFCNITFYGLMYEVNGLPVQPENLLQSDLISKGFNKLKIF